jgi:hypothetical protein
MSRRTSISTIYLYFLPVLFLGIFSAEAFSQEMKLTIRCAPKTEAKTTKQEQKIKNGKATKTADEAPRFKLDAAKEKSAAKENLVETVNAIPLGCTAQAVITAYLGPANSTVNFLVTQDNPENILDLRYEENDTPSHSIVVPVQLDGNGYGESNPFHIYAKELGETFLIGESPISLTNPLHIAVVECKCPFIPVYRPPR